MANDTVTLLKKYDVPVPRYTSYPTVPFWDFGTVTVEKWRQAVIDTFVAENGALSIYIHLPFCEQLCTFCACNKRITTNHRVEEPYIDSVIKEWQIYRSWLPTKPLIREIHLGGGTPTFFSPENLKRLIEAITGDAEVDAAHEFSVEVHPNYTTEEHLAALASVGFNRISMGVQDFDPVVQFIINRIQTFEKTREVVEWSRALGYGSVNIDLVYGLPKQTLDSIELTVRNIGELMPDRIAFYSYAHVPWKSKVQRRYTGADLPDAEEKWQMYHRGSAMLQAMGFTSIGMDHFALPDDAMMTAYASGALHRNFMGYTTTNNKLIIGLGVSSIGDAWHAFAQNEKTVETYEEKIRAGVLPLVNGHMLNAEDVMLRRNILDLMCKGLTVLPAGDLEPDLLAQMRAKLDALRGDGLVTLNGDTIRVGEKGRLLIRNICSALDARLLRSTPQQEMFSRAI